jgi:hypothetical protein
MRIPVFNTLHEAFLYCRDMDASLHERLEAFSEATRYLIPGYQEAVDRMVRRLKAYDVGHAAPRPALSNSEQRASSEQRQSQAL